MSFRSKKNPNPQGKGLVPVVADWESTRPSAVRGKAPAELLLDWFFSALVLSAEFKFRPVPEQGYFLYAREGRWRLSLIAPHEWLSLNPGECLGLCRLRRDMTWAVEPVADLHEKPQLRAALSTLVESFMHSLDSDEPLEDKLPGYRAELPYHQRMLATGLGAGLRASVARRELLAESARQLLSAAEDGLSRGLLDRLDGI